MVRLHEPKKPLGWIEAFVGILIGAKEHEKVQHCTRCDGCFGSDCLPDQWSICSAGLALARAPGILAFQGFDGPNTLNCAADLEHCIALIERRSK